MKPKSKVTIDIKDAGEFVESFVENKDLAKKWRETLILPHIKKGDLVVLDFEGVEAVTQSFVHALISYSLQESGERVLELMEFKSCNDSVKQIIMTVIEYSLEKSAQGRAEKKRK